MLDLHGDDLCLPRLIKPASVLALAGVMALVSRCNRSVLGYKGLLSALKRIEIFVLDMSRATSGK
jgi:hypothetical protein